MSTTTIDWLRPARLTGRLAAAVVLAVIGGMLLVGTPSASAAPSSVKTLFDSSCPYGMKSGETSGCVTRLQTELNAKAHAGLDVDGVFGAATKKAVISWQSKHKLAKDGIVGPATKKSLGDAKPKGSSVGGTISRSEVVNRSQNWVNAKTPYSQKHYFPDAQGRNYREDCSGFVSMAWHLPQSRATWTLPAVATKISKSSLKPGDILDIPHNHTVLVVDRPDSTHITIREESNPGVPTHQKTVRLSSYSSFTAYRYNHISN